MSGPTLVTRAPAKVNLTLHVLGRRPDGYHELDSLVAFAGMSDHLTLRPGQSLELSVSGPTASLAGPPGQNLVLQAAEALAARVPGLRMGSFGLVKRLPAAAGIGGGSSDAAAALRLLARANGLAIGDRDVIEAARATGADVLVCLAPRARVLQGAGERVGPALELPPLPCVLVNPGVAVPTPAVFKALGLAPGQSTCGDAHPDVPAGSTGSELLDALVRARNDLEPAATLVAPAIGAALRRLRTSTGCRLARMSGSGATVFALYEDRLAASRAARLIREAEPGWWVKATFLR